MEVSTELRAEIIAELRKTRAPAKAARNLGLDIATVLKISDEIGGTSRQTREEQYDGEGRPELRQFLVARKFASLPWDNTIPEVAQARRDYEAGTHEMCTGRDGNWLLLYSIPRRKPEPRPFYFTPEI